MTRSEWLVFGAGSVLSVATLAAFAAASPEGKTPPAPCPSLWPSSSLWPTPSPPPIVVDLPCSCVVYRLSSRPLPYRVIQRAHELLPKPDKTVIVERYDGTCWRYLREPHPPSATNPQWHAGVTVTECIR